MFEKLKKDVKIFCKSPTPTEQALPIWYNQQLIGSCQGSLRPNDVFVRVQIVYKSHIFSETQFWTMSSHSRNKPNPSEKININWEVSRLSYPNHCIYRTGASQQLASRFQTYWADSPVWSESSLCAQWLAKDTRFPHADSEDSDQTGRMPRLIWVFAGRTLILLVLSWGGSDFFVIKELLSFNNGKPVTRSSEQYLGNSGFLLFKGEVL